MNNLFCGLMKSLGKDDYVFCAEYSVVWSQNVDSMKLRGKDIESIRNVDKEKNRKDQLEKDYLK